MTDKYSLSHKLAIMRVITGYKAVMMTTMFILGEYFTAYRYIRLVRKNPRNVVRANKGTYTIPPFLKSPYTSFLFHINTYAKTAIKYVIAETRRMKLPETRFNTNL
jgi:hypothetical protein